MRKYIHSPWNTHYDIAFDSSVGHRVKKVDNWIKIFDINIAVF